MLKKLAQTATAAVATASIVAPALAQSYYTYDSSAGDAAFLGFNAVIWCCLCVFGLIYLGLKIYATIDLFKRNFGTDNSGQIIGLVLIWLVDWILPFIGLILYYFLVAKKYPKKA